MKSLFVVEDNDAIRKLFTTILKKQGYIVMSFSDGQSAINEIQNLKPDLLILDILLPDINGTELISKIRSIPHCKDIPAIAVTGFATEQDENRFIEAGFNSYLSKPIDTVKFCEVVKQILI